MRCSFLCCLHFSFFFCCFCICFFVFLCFFFFFFFFSSRRRHTRCLSDWSSDVCSSDLCDHVDADLAEHEPLGGRHIGVARPDDLGDRRDRLGAVGERGHRLRSEERRVGKECRCRWWPEDGKKQKQSMQEARQHGQERRK